MSIVTLPPVSRADEIRFGRDVSAWLAVQTSPANAILWRQNWNAAIFVDHVSSLRSLIAALPRGEYAGLTRKGSHGPWAQVRAFEDRGSHVRGWPLELHPHTWSLGVPQGVWKLISDDASDVAGHLWDWVATGTAPAEHPEPTTHPKQGQGYW
jgi:hypothetical protein